MYYTTASGKLQQIVRFCNGNLAEEGELWYACLDNETILRQWNFHAAYGVI